MVTLLALFLLVIAIYNLPKAHSFIISQLQWQHRVLLTEEKL